MELYTQPNKYASPPGLNIQNNVAEFLGYQKFSVSKYGIDIDKSDTGLLSKKEIFDTNIPNGFLHKKTVLDLGCNSAFFCYYSRLKGAAFCDGVEIDKTYIQNVERANAFLEIDNIKINDKNVMDYNKSADLVFAFALIHWIYSCTSDYGSLDLAVKQLAELTKQVLIVEWIEKEDGAIQFFKHIDYNKELITQEYSRENFEKALVKHFSGFKVIGEVSKTRVVYLAYKSIGVKQALEGVNSVRALPDNGRDFLTSVFLSKIEDDFFKYTNTQSKEYLAQNFSIKPQQNNVSEVTTNYVVISNWDLLLNNSDSLYDGKVEVLSSKNCFGELIELILYSGERFISDAYKNEYLFGCRVQISAEKKIYLLVYNTNEKYLPNSLTNALLSNTSLLNGIKVPFYRSYVYYLLFKTVYILSAAENGILSQVLLYDNKYDLGLKDYNLSNIAFLEQVLESDNCSVKNYNLLLGSNSMEYIYPPNSVLSSRVVDSSTGRFFISRVYLIKQNDKLCIVKQGNHNLASKEYKILSSLDSAYFTKVFNPKVSDLYQSFEMEFFEGEQLALLIKNDELDLHQKLYICYHLICAIKYLYSNNIEHRDINPYNILFNGSEIKIIDFGWAKLKGEKVYTPMGLNEEFSLHKSGINSNDFYSALKIIELLLEPEINIIGMEIITETKKIIENFHQVKYLFTTQCIFSLEELLFLKLSQVEKENKIMNVSSYENGDKGSEIENEIQSNAEDYYRESVLLLKQGKINLAYEKVNQALILFPENNDIFDLCLEISQKITTQKTELAQELSGKLEIKLEKELEEEPEGNLEDSNYKFEVSIVIPIFNKVKYTINCLTHLYQNTDNKYSYEVIIVDNGSQDNSEQIIKHNFADYDNFVYIRNEYNLGFAKACNIGIKNRQGKDVILLNNDTLPLPNWLHYLIEEARADEKIGIAGATLLYPNTEYIQHCGVQIGTEDGVTLAPYHIDNFEVLSHSTLARKSRYVQAVTGATFYIKSETINKIGYLDELYINGLEDIDYCFLAGEAGYKVLSVADSILYHYESISEDRHKYDVQNWHRLNRKWLGKVVFDESKEVTNERVNKIKNRRNDISELGLQGIGEMQEGGPQFTGTNEVLYSIIIPIHNNLAISKICLQSIWENVPDVNQIEIIVINNGSDEETSLYLSSLGNRIILLHNQDNQTYAKVNNQGAKIAKGKYLICLNNDVKLLNSNWFYQIQAYFEENPSVAIQGAKLTYPNGKIQHCGIVWGNVGLDFPLHYHIYLTLDKDEKCVNKTREYQFVTGAFLAIRKEVFEIVGGFDQVYKFGHEDLDLCLKVRQIGGSVVCNHKIEAIHFESETKKLLGVEQFERFIHSKNTYDLENHKYFLSKWSDVIKVDADKYFDEDGFWGLSSKVELRKEFEQSVVMLLDELSKLHILKNTDVFKMVCQKVFKSDKVPEKVDTRLLLALSIDEIRELLHVLQSVEKSEDNDNVTKTQEDTGSKDAVEQMTILMTMYGWNESGGGTLLPKQLAIALAEKGYRVIVFFAAGEHPVEKQMYFREIKQDSGVELVGVYNRQTTFLNSHLPELDIKDENVTVIFKEIVEQVKPDIIHFHNFLGLSLAISEIAKNSRSVTFYSPHNYFMVDPNLYMINEDLVKWESTNFFENSNLPQKYPTKIKTYAIRQNKVKEALKNVDYIFATSRKVGSIISDIIGNKDNMFLVNHLPKLMGSAEKQSKQVSVNKKKLTIAYIGGVMIHKGVHNLFLALKNVDFEYELLIFGFVLDTYKRYLDSLSLGINVKFIGEYKQENLSTLLAHVDCIAVTSIWEDCAPLVLAEGLSLNIPIIGANIGGIPDFVKHNYNGLLYKYNDVNDLRRTLKRFSEDVDLRQKLIKNAKLTYTFDEYVKHFELVYTKVKKGNNTFEIKLNRQEIELKFLDNSSDSYLWEEVLDSQTGLAKNYQVIDNNKGEIMVSDRTNEDDNNYNNKGNYMETQKQSHSENQGMNRIKFEANLVNGFSNKDAVGVLPSPLPNPLKLNLGCGKDIQEGFINIDLFSENPTVIKMDIRDLQIPDLSVDYILANDVLEHFSFRETDKVLREWARVLKPGAYIEIRCPNLELQLKAYARGDWNADIASYMIFGGQTNPGDYHCVGFDERSIKNHLAYAGFEVISYQDLDYPQTNGYINLNMQVKARKLITNSIVEYSTGTSDNLAEELPETEQETKIISDNSIKYEKAAADFAFQHQNEVTSNDTNPKLNVVWEGTQFVYHSLALVNREQCINLINSEQVNLTIVPYEKNEFDPTQDERFLPLITNDVRYKSEVEADVLSLPYVWIRHQWPPKKEVPLGSKWILMQPWEFSSLRKDFIEPFSEADEIWTPSNFSRMAFINSGIDADKIQVIPNGVNPLIFTPLGIKYPLKTKKKLKFLFLGGTIPRKGIDLLLQAYVSTFSFKDDVCLIIKDLGGDSFYQGLTADAMIDKIMSEPNAPEIEYINNDLTEEEIASLYRACDVFVSPYRGEGFSLPTLEAMACGLPVVVTQGGSTDDFVDETVGWLIPSSKLSIGEEIDGYPLVQETFILNPDIQTLAEILLSIYKKPTNLKVLGLKGSLRARENWTWKKSTLKILSRLDSLYNLNLSQEAKEKFNNVYDLPMRLAEADILLMDANQQEAEKKVLSVIEEFLSDNSLQSNNLDYYIYSLHLLCVIYLDYLEENEIYDIVNEKLDELELLGENLIDTYFIRSVSLVSKGKLTDALEYLTKCIQMWNESRFSSNISLTLDLILINTADILMNMQDFAGAKEVLNSSLDIAPENWVIHMNLAKCLSVLGDIQKAEFHLLKAKEINPELK